MIGQLPYNIFLVIIILVWTNCQQETILPPNSPNFLLILTDDLDYSEIGCYGGEIPTPNIDQLAKEGILFTNFHTNKEDSKLRATLLTGTSQAQIPTTNKLQPPAITIAQLLKEAGYRTAMSGKWNLGMEKEDMPIKKGFEQSFALMEETANHLGNKRYFPARYRQNNNIKEISEDFYTTQYFSRQLLSFLSPKKKKERGKPFFAFLSFTVPHYPLQAPNSTIQNFNSQYDEGYQAIYENRLSNQLALGIHTGIERPNLPNWNNLSPELQTYEARKMEIYAAMVFDLDKHIGRIMDFLKVSKQYDNTVIIFLSDAGVSAPQNTRQFADLDNSLENIGKANSMVTLGKGWTSLKLGDKKTIEEDALKAPLIIRYPQNQKAGSKNDVVHTAADIVPTILKMIGLPHPSESYFENALSLEGKPIL